MAIELQYEFEAELFLWSARREVWTFVQLPDDASADVVEVAGDVPRGWGAVKVLARIGTTTWRTSVFPDAARGGYVLPVKREVRERNGLGPGDTASVWLEVLP